MENDEKLELIWVAREHPPGEEPREEPRIRVEQRAQDEDSPATSLEAVMEVCGEPRCTCLTILFRWQPPRAAAPAAPAPPRDFWLDLRELAVVPSPELDECPESRRLAERIRASLTPADQQRLREWYLAAKLELIQSTPVSHIDIGDLPNADGGKMIGFVDVFPCGGLALNFRLNNEAWAVDEQYCVQPQCRCTETVLSFLKLMDASGRKTEAIREAPTLRYDYLSEKTKTLELVPGSPSPQVLLDVLKREQPTLNLQLERRHLILQCLYARHYQAPAQARLRNLICSPASRSLRIGRNDPCPCGSGRKFKHCCLNKPSS